MKLALLLFGLSKLDYYHIKLKKNMLINYEKSIDNYKKYIYEYFENKGYDIDVYFTTNILNDDEKEKIIKTFKPISCNFLNNHKNKKIGRSIKFKNVVKLCLDSKIDYDLVLITRFDLIFNIDFNNSNIDLNKFNLVSTLEKPGLICDNFYLFPYKFLDKFYELLLKVDDDKAYHFILDTIEEINGKDFINYILDEKVKVEFLSFYTIVRNYK